MSGLNSIRAQAVEILMKEVLTHVYEQMHEAYMGLVQENNKIRKISASFCSFNGVIYPQKTVNGSKVPTKVIAPPLHCTLLPKLQEIDAMMEQVDPNKLKNFFTAVINNSYHNITLKGLLPNVLVDTLRTNLSELQFTLLDRGGRQYQIIQTKEETEHNIALIEEHYGETAEYLREVLVFKLLLGR